ncbi:histidine phosphatase family protein [Shewanella submarina]|uniref:Histidine phosphatase family protein n=1 Tax=Shewanella submarina TaxID=2016376 RepID=A0ABV7GLH8_9GAMM|nr:histidine phosphatase family protein [Shewanella submarina]MCL1035587.1 histidine phosphatase family protein [Shewanella submarina]
MNKQLYILRHGQTRFNAEGKLQGHCNSPLTELGESQARALGTALARALTQDGCPVDEWQLIASPLGRAVQTAQLVCEGLGLDNSAIHTDERVMEARLGDWEQQEIATIMAAHPELDGRGDWYLQAPNAESLVQIRSRLQNWLQDPATPDKVILVSHGLTGVVLRGMLQHLDDDALWQQDKPQDAFYHFREGQLNRIKVSC